MTPRDACLLVAAAMLATRVVPAQEPWVLVGVTAPAGPLELSTLGYVLGDLDLRGGTIEARRHALPWLSVAAGYMLNRRRVGDGDVREHRARLDVTLRARAWRARLSGRSLLERRWSRAARDDQADVRTATNVLRVRLRTELPASRRWLPEPFVTVEPFFDVGAGRLSRTWLGAGLGRDISRLRVEPSYLHRLERAGPDAHTVVIALTLRR